MNIHDKINHSLSVIQGALEASAKPVIACSFGKDSQVMLYLIRQIRTDIPMLYFRGFEHPQKHFFADLMINTLDLDIIPAQPVATDIVALGGHVEIVEDYRLTDEAALYFPIEPEPGHVPGPGSRCAVEKLNQPCEGKPIGVDSIFIGARADDVDPVHGPMPLERYVAGGRGVLFVYPLRDWTEANVWEASELLNIPQNQARYVRKDMDANADYFPLCVECLKPTDKPSVICPKIGEPVYAIGKHLNLERRREEWRDKFVNLKREQ